MVSSTNPETYSPVRRTGNSESHPVEMELDGNLANEGYPFRRGVKDHWYDYCSTNGIHGTCYLAQNRTWIEIIVWIIIILVSCGGCFYMINEIYQKYLESPVIISVASQQAKLNDIPLPAVTICPWGIIGSKCFEEPYKSRFSPEEMEIREKYANMLCKSAILDKTENEEATKILEFLDECAPELDIQYVYGLTDSSRESWTKIFTTEGVCYSFNMMDRSELYNDNVVYFKNYSVFQKSVDWDFTANNYAESKAPTQSYPRRAIYTGIQNGLTIMIRQIDEPYKICKNYVKGFKTMLHMPTRVPDPDEDSFYVRGNKSVMATIFPSTVRTSSVVRKYPLEKRNCVFQGEVPLVHYRSYSEKNCIFDQLTKVILESGACTMFWMPRSFDKSNKWCSNIWTTTLSSKVISSYKLFQEIDQNEIEQFEDLQKANNTDDVFKVLVKNYENITDDYTRQETIKEIKSMFRQTYNLHKKLKTCLPSCTDVNYDVDVIPYSLDIEEFFRELADNDEDGQASKSYKPKSFMTSGVQLYFKSKRVSTMERNELYGVSDFISNFGGILGLFTGFSLISAVEIIYFLSLRLWANRKLYNYWAIPGTGDPR